MPKAAECLEKAEHIVKVVKEQSYFDGFFHDHALRQEDGSLLVVKEDVTETCQYYAFFFETAAPETYPELWKILLEDFGPGRVEKGLWKEIYPSNAFIGYYLRLELLSRMELGELLLENIEGFFGYMAARTGTLWEHNDTSASCNHGFASHVLVWLRKFVK
jgi:alpha-L-rhamnosidase